MLLGCGPASDEGIRDTETGDAAATLPTRPPIIDIEATEYAFTAPPTFPSGWVTLRLANNGEQPHFAILWRLPEGHSFDDWAAEVAQPFNTEYQKYRAGELGRDGFLEELGGMLPEWFGKAEPMGGPGFTAPGRTSQTTVFLEPGEYAIECYVRATEQADTFHNGLGMLRPLIVTEESTGAEPPEADLEIVLRNGAMTVSGDPGSGEQTVAVRVEERSPGLIQHNVHLAKLEPDATAAAAIEWLDWVDTMLPPAPVEYLGGAGQTWEGGESYLTVDLAPGRYAWVSEAGAADGMVHEFVVE